MDIDVKSVCVSHHKAEALLEVDVSDAAVPFEEPLHVLLPSRRAQSADENTTPAHVVDFTCEKKQTQI